MSGVGTRRKLMADSTSHRHEMLGASEEEIERRMRNHYPDAVAIWRAERQQQRRGGDLHNKQDTRGGFRR